MAVSVDGVAVDALGIAILKRFSPNTERVAKLPTWRNPMILAATERKLGIDHPRKLTLSAATVPHGDVYLSLARQH